jgi:hypothetical protein
MADVIYNSNRNDNDNNDDSYNNADNVDVTKGHGSKRNSAPLVSTSIIWN